MNTGSTKAGNTAKGEGGDETATLTLDEQKQMWDEMSSVSPDDGPGLSYGGPRTRKQLHNQTKQYRNTKVVKQGTRLDKSTTGKNLFGLTYAGPNNPLSFNKTDNFSFVPISKADYPAIGHDRRYSNLGVSGLKGLLFDSRTSGADFHFVLEQFYLTISPFTDLRTKALSFTLGMGLGAIAVPKTTLGMYSPAGRMKMISSYFISSKGVTNKPTRRQ